MTKKNLYDFTGSILLGWGSAAILSPFFLAWWIHGDYERYLWIISGPEPYRRFGGGPYQMAMGLGLLLLGLMICVVGMYLRKISR